MVASFVGKVSRFVFKWLVPALVLFFAIFIGWLNVDTDMPLAKLFATIIPLTKGFFPSTIRGHGHMPGTPPVPDDMKPLPRPVNERFITLPGGHQMPQNGLGMCCRPTAYDDVLVERTVLWYLLLGGRLIDGAQLYLNHKAIGRGIKEAMRRGVPREEIFVTTKLYYGFYGRNTTKETVPKFLDELGLDYIDLVLMHLPNHPLSFIYGVGVADECKRLKLNKTECRQETWKGLSDLRQRGIVRNVGVSNFVVEQLQELMVLKEGEEEEEDDIAPIANNQIQFNPWLSQEWAKSAAFCHIHGISITGWNSLGGTFQHHAALDIKVLTELSEKHRRSVAQIMLRWALQKNVIVIPGTGNPEYMKENLSIYDFELSDEDVQAIDALNTAEEMKAFIVMPASVD